MKKINTFCLSFLLAMSLFSSCTTTKSSVKEQPIKIEEFNRDEYVILDKVNGEAKSFRLWVLFIPFGGTDDQILYERAYSSAVGSAVGQQADWLLEPRYTYKKTIIPLILVSFTTKKVTAEGKAFRLKSEEEYQQSKELNKK